MFLYFVIIFIENSKETSEVRTSRTIVPKITYLKSTYFCLGLFYLFFVCCICKLNNLLLYILKIDLVLLLHEGFIKPITEVNNTNS